MITIKMISKKDPNEVYEFRFAERTRTAAINRARHEIKNANKEPDDFWPEDEKQEKHHA